MTSCTEVTETYGDFDRRWRVSAPVITATVLGATWIAGCSPDGAPRGTTMGTAPTTSILASPATTPKPSVAPAPQVGVREPTRDQPFEFTVTSVFTEDVAAGAGAAQGVFLVIRLTVKNIGTTAQQYSSANQTLVDKQGRVFSPDSETTSKSWNASAIRLNINPGNETDSAFLDFDVPKGTEPKDYVLWLHSSSNSDGAAVQLKSCAYEACV